MSGALERGSAARTGSERDGLASIWRAPPSLIDPRSIERRASVPARSDIPVPRSPLPTGCRSIGPPCDDLAAIHRRLTPVGDGRGAAARRLGAGLPSISRTPGAGTDLYGPRSLRLRPVSRLLRPPSRHLTAIGGTAPRHLTATRRIHRSGIRAANCATRRIAGARLACPGYRRVVGGVHRPTKRVGTIVARR